jgi:CRISPR-associated protein Csx10
MTYLIVTMKSDWHVGAGMGRGELDSIVQRDDDNLPYIPGKTLTGILRDSCEQVALGLDNGSASGIWHQWVNFIFGDQPALAKGAVEKTPQPALIAIDSAYLHDDLRRALKGKKQLQAAIAFIKPGVALDPITGTAKPDFLRFEEVVRLGAKLTAQVELNLPDSLEQKQQAAIAGLLASGAKLTERLGGKRRRGNGLCRFELSDHSDQKIQWLKENYDSVGAPPELDSSKLTSPETNPEQAPPWHCVPLTITTRSPLVLPARTVGNVVECLDHIPGRYLLGHIHKTLGQYFDVSQAIAAEQLVITNGTIEIDEQGGRPTPFCLFGEKLDGGLGKGKGVYNRFQEQEPDQQLKGERGGYIGQFDGNYLPKSDKVKFQLFTHNTIEDKVQRPTEEVGGVYSYQAIPAKTTFRAELRLPASLVQLLNSKKSNWRQELNGTTRIGQSKKDQYGKIQITTENVTTFAEPEVNAQTLSVWLLSDLLLRGDRLNVSASPDDLQGYLEKALEVKLKERDDPNLMSVALRSCRTESWQTRWGLPRPSLIGWQAGSCLIYDIESVSIDSEKLQEKLQELMITGIGDRRVEGYGQVSFNDPLLSAQLSRLEAQPTANQANNNSTPFLLSNNNAIRDYARLIETATWREAIQNKALALGASRAEREKFLGIRISSDGNSQPTMTQLGALRSVLRRLRSPNDHTIVTAWLTSLNNTPNRQEKWDGTAGGLNKIRNLVTNQDQIWADLGIDFRDLSLTRTAQTELKPELWAEAIRTLIDAIIRGHKRDLEKVQENNQEAA